jgi:phage shock protein C
MNPLMIIVYIIASIIIPIVPEGVLYDFSKEPEKIKAESDE